MPQTRYVLSLDVGTTSLKGVLFDTSGRQVANSLREYELVKPAPDIVELDSDVYWNRARDVIRHILAAGAVDPRQIASIGITSQGETLTVLDAAGRPLRRSIVWLDNRSQPEADEIGRRFGLDEVYRTTGQQELVPTWTATRILWLRKHEPEVFRKAHRYLLVEDLLIYRLTGRYVTDRGLTPSTLYYDLNTCDWWPEMLEFLGITRQQLPELSDSGGVAGPVTVQAADETGLAAGTLVTTAPLDQIAGAVGAGNIEPGIVTETTGAALAVCASIDRPVYDPQKRVGLYTHAIKGQYVLLPWVPTAGMVLRWFRDELGGGRDYGSLVDEARQIPPGAEGLTVLPHLSGAGCPHFDPKARGVFWGITLGHRRGHFVRAILEAVAFMLRSNLELLDRLGVAVHQVRSLGGATKSDLCMQIKADVCRKNMVLMDSEEAACLGVAMLSCVGSGIYRNLCEARDAMVRTEKTIHFDPRSADVYDEVYRRNMALYDNVHRFY
jgi:xylulokinase